MIREKMATWHLTTLEPEKKISGKSKTVTLMETCLLF